MRGSPRVISPLFCVATLLSLVGCATNQSASLRAPGAAAAERRAALPLLPAPEFYKELHAYSDASAGLPVHFLRSPTSVRLFDNTPADNKISDAGAALGRVLFYEARLSANNSTSCSSCHIQQFGFGDTARFSIGFNGKRTVRHSMALANSRFGAGSYFWDQRAPSLEQQVLMPIQDSIEMGMQLDILIPKLQETRFYPSLFQAAFGTNEITQQRIAFALAQFVRSLVSAQSPLDPPLLGAPPAIRPRLDPQGPLVFNLQCANCHVPAAFAIDAAHNIGLDSIDTDNGAGGGRFKAPSLRNIAVRPPYMHDGRFTTLREVVEFYDHGVQPNANLDPRLRNRELAPVRLNLSPAQITALVAYLETFTDSTFLTDPRFADPFQKKKKK